MKQYKVGILGATGAVGREMMKILLERDFPVSELHLFASERSAGKVVAWNGKPIQIELAAEGAFDGLDIVLGAASGSVAREFAPAIVKAGAVFVDNSSAFRLDPDVPLIVPEVNPDDVKAHKGIISNPNCSTVIAVTAINALRQLSPIDSMVASTYQAVSGAGAGGPIELSEEVNALIKGFADGKHVRWVDFNSRLVRPDGTISKDLMPDFLHPRVEGYRIWAETALPYFKTACGK